MLDIGLKEGKGNIMKITAYQYIQTFVLGPTQIVVKNQACVSDTC